jgi:hypothetical protein
VKIATTALVALLLSARSFAAPIEVGLGKTANTTAATYSIGIITSAFDQQVRVGYLNLSTPVANQNVEQKDLIDDQLAGWGEPPCHWLPQKMVHAIYVTADPVVYIGEGTVVRTEFGAVFYRPQWQQDICQNAANEPPHAYSAPWNVHPTFGLVFERGDVSYALTRTTITQSGDWEGQNPSSTRISFVIRMRLTGETR